MEVLLLRINEYLKSSPVLEKRTKKSQLPQKEFTSIPIMFNSSSTKKKQDHDHGYNTSFSDWMCPTLLLKSTIIGMLPQISITTIQR
jgi:hypothetical protein